MCNKGSPAPFSCLRMLPKNCQMLLFSATFEESVWNFAQRIVPEPNIIKLKREEETLDTIKQYYVLCNSKEEKFQALCNIYGAITIAQAMIFCHVSVEPPLMTNLGVISCHVAAFFSFISFISW